MSGREDSERKGRRRVKWKRKLWGKQVKINLRREGRDGFGKESKDEKEERRGKFLGRKGKDRRKAGRIQSVFYIHTRVHCLYSLLYKTPGTMYTLSYIVFILFTSALFCCCLIYSQHYGRLSCIRKRERKKNTKNNILNINVAGRNN